MITLILLLVAALAILVIVTIGAVCWPILLVGALLLGADVALFKFVFGRKKSEGV